MRREKKAHYVGVSDLQFINQIKCKIYLPQIDDVPVELNTQKRFGAQRKRSTNKMYATD